MSTDPLIIPEQVESRTYEMDPVTDVLLFSGEELAEGYIVLVEDPGFRFYREDEYAAGVHKTESSSIIQERRMTNRWCRVLRVDIDGGSKRVSFTGIYADGVVRKRSYSLEVAWLAKRESVIFSDTNC